jgi:Lon protease-like protein
MNLDVDEIPAAALEALAIFPLPDVVLFPGQLLPLHVFEPRYRALVADTLEGSNLICVPRLRPGYEAQYEGRPPVYEVAGVGMMVASERLGDGRYHIVLRGVGRVHIEAELPAERVYRLVRSRLLDDGRSAAGAAALDAAHQTLVALCDRLAAGVDEDGDVLRQLARAAITPGGCADVVAAALVRDADTRQRLLEECDPAERLDLVTAHVTALVALFAADGGGAAPN